MMEKRWYVGYICTMLRVDGATDEVEPCPQDPIGKVVPDGAVCEVQRCPTCLHLMTPVTVDSVH